LLGQRYGVDAGQEVDAEQTALLVMQVPSAQSFGVAAGHPLMLLQEAKDATQDPSISHLKGVAAGHPLAGKS
jgi:hypothetical protein